MARRQNVDVPIPTMETVSMSIRKKHFFLNIQNNFNYFFEKKHVFIIFDFFFTVPDDPEPIDVDIPKKRGEKQNERARHAASAQQFSGEKTF